AAALHPARPRISTVPVRPAALPFDPGARGAPGRRGALAARPSGADERALSAGTASTRAARAAIRCPTRAADRLLALAVAIGLDPALRHARTTSAALWGAGADAPPVRVHGRSRAPARRGGRLFPESAHVSSPGSRRDGRGAGHARMPRPGGRGRRRLGGL